VLRLAGKPIRDFEMTLRERVLSVILDPNVAFALFIVGALLVFVELKAPGTIAPGAVGVALILTSIFAFQLLPLRYAGVGLILLAFALFALEAKYTSHGLLGAGGAVAMVLGALLLVDAPIPEMRIKLGTAIAITLPFAVITVMLATLAYRAHLNKVTTGVEGLIGEVGVARTQLAPAGKVFVHGELWDASSHLPVETGEQVVVRHVEGLRLEVEPVAASQRAQG
jgi:membrane-bound serine protease (ClpP class)